jgi:hypothetical protein
MSDLDGALQRAARLSAVPADTGTLREFYRDRPALLPESDITAYVMALPSHRARLDFVLEMVQGIADRVLVIDGLIGGMVLHEAGDNYRRQQEALRLLKEIWKG